MKKFIVSSVVVVSFVAYSLYQRILGVQAAPINSPKSVSSLPSSSPTPTPTSTPSPTRSNSATATPTPSTSPGSPTSTPQNTSTPTPKPNSPYKDGTYTGDAADAFYGNIQVQATISNGKITNIEFLQAPSDRSTSVEINSQADPILAQEAIQKQSAQVDIVSGATDSSNAFVQSMQSALDKAKS